MGPGLLKCGLAALGLLCKVLCHHLFIIPRGLSALASPTWKGQAWVRCMLPPPCPSHFPSSVSVSELWIVQKKLRP